MSAVEDKYENASNISQIKEAMMKTPFIVFATITLKPEFYEDAKEAILNITPQTLAEPGCRVFALHEPSSSDGTTLYIYEIFDSEEAFHFHHSQSYTKAVYKSYENWLAAPVEIKILARVVQ